MKRILSVLLTGALCMGIMAGCSSGGGAASSASPSSAGDTPASSAAEATSGEATTVVVWTMSRADAAYIQPKVEEYNKNNTDGITIQYDIYTDNYKQALDMAFNTNSGPDLVCMPNSLEVFTKYVPNGQYLPIDEYLTDEEKEMYKTLRIEGATTFDGQLYWIPEIGTTGRLIYNKDIFERCGITEPPATLSELVTAAKTITDKLSGEGIYGFAANLKSPGSAMERSLNFMVERSGGPKQGFDFAQGKYDFSFYKPFIETFRTLFSTGIAFPGCESLDIDPLRTQFAAGKIGMYISWTHAEPGVYSTQFPTDQNWDAAPIPILDGAEAASQEVIPYNGYLINKTCKNPDKAWLVCRDLFYNIDYCVGYHEAGLGSALVPAVQEKAKAPDLIKDQPNFNLDTHDRLWPAVPHELNSQAVIVEGNDQYASFMALIYGSDDIEAGLADITARYNAAYEKGIADGKGKEVKIDNWDPANPAG